MTRPPTEETLENCRRCDLWKNATQAVPGEGSRSAAIMLVGEQPGDEEDRRGHPFVGPAGRLLDETIAAAGLERKQLFVTNAVKHFKWEPRGKRRLHKKPGAGEIKAKCLGATALKALTRSSLTIEAARRQDISIEQGATVVATYHPSALLRAEGDRAQELRDLLVHDLRRAAKLAGKIP
jgi:uracil-DNA glycosylase